MLLSPFSLLPIVPLTEPKRINITKDPIKMKKKIDAVQNSIDPQSCEDPSKKTKTVITDKPKKIQVARPNPGTVSCRVIGMINLKNEHN